MADENAGLLQGIGIAVTSILGSLGLVQVKTAVQASKIERLEKESEENTKAHASLTKQGIETATTLGHLRNDVHDIKKSVDKLAEATQEIATKVVR